jgi:hypothetical protein
MIAVGVFCRRPRQLCALPLQTVDMVRQLRAGRPVHWWSKEGTAARGSTCAFICSLAGRRRALRETVYLHRRRLAVGNWWTATNYTA